MGRALDVSQLLKDRCNILSLNLSVRKQRCRHLIKMGLYFCVGLRENLTGEALPAHSDTDEPNAVTANQPGPVLALVPLCSLRRSCFHQMRARKELMSLSVPIFEEAYLTQPLSHTCHSRYEADTQSFVGFFQSSFFPLCSSFTRFWALPLCFLQSNREEPAGWHCAVPGLRVLVLPGSPAPASNASLHPSSAAPTFLGRRGLTLRGALCLLSLRERSGWKLGFSWRGPLNLALAEGNNKVTDFIYLCAVCVASYAPYTVRPKSWC